MCRGTGPDHSSKVLDDGDLPFPLALNLADLSCGEIGFQAISAFVDSVDIDIYYICNDRLFYLSSITS